METKSINSLASVEPNATRKMLCGDGVIALSNLKDFILSETLTTLASLSSALSELSSDIDALESTSSAHTLRLTEIAQTLSSLASRLSSVEAASSMLGAVFEEDSEGKLVMIEERIEWRTVKVKEGVYTQRFVKIEDENES